MKKLLFIALFLAVPAIFGIGLKQSTAEKSKHTHEVQIVGHVSRGTSSNGTISYGANLSDGNKVTASKDKKGVYSAAILKKGKSQKLDHPEIYYSKLEGKWNDQQKNIVK